VSILDNAGKPTGQTAENHRADISEVLVGWNKTGNLLACVIRFKTERSNSSAVVLYALPATSTKVIARFRWQDHANQVMTDAADSRGPLPSNTWDIKYEPAGGMVCFVLPISISDQAKQLSVDSFDRTNESDLRGFDVASPIPIPEKPK
jgi:hypothetical protein